MRLDLDTDLLGLLPPWYREILDYAEICRTEEEELKLLADAIRAVRDNLFFPTMDEGTCADWEAVFSILADPATETVEFRRARILSRLSARPPFTLRFLERKLDELIGAGKWTVCVDYAHYTLTVELTADAQSYVDEAAFLAFRIKPAHIVLTVARRLDLTAATLAHGACAELAPRMEVWPRAACAIDTTAAVAAGGLPSLHATLEIYPQGGLTNA